MTKPVVLCVDDEFDNIEALERLLRPKYTVLKAESGRKALQILKNFPDPISVIVTDQRMPEMNGVDFLEKTLETHPDAIRILLTGYMDIESIISAINSGQIYRYINKPWDPIDFTQTVDQAVQKYNLQEELREKNRVLEKAYEELNTLDQAKDNFMILINHELKTPLTTIMSFVQLLSETDLNSSQKLYCQRINKASEKLKSIVEDVLTIVSAETKNIKLKTRNFHISELSLKFSESIEKMKLEKKLKTNFVGLENKVLFDSDYLEKIILKLLGNAIRFAYENTTIECKVEVVQSHRLKISISNQGPTIPENLIPKLTQPFFINEDIMNHTSGLGLGLTYCHSLLKVQSSGIHIENTDQGVKTWFELPFL